MSLTAADQEVRATGIGASEIFKVITDPLPVYMRKTGQAGPDNETWAMKRGTMLEPVLREWRSEDLGFNLRKGSTVRHPSIPWALCTPDAYWPGDEILEEYKAPLPWGASQRYGDGPAEIPPYVWTQAIWQMLVTGARLVNVVAWDGVEAYYRVYPVQYDADAADGLLAFGEEFWLDHVLQRIPPEPKDDTQVWDWLKARFPRTVKADLLPADEECEEWAAALLRAKRLESEADAIKKEYSPKLLSRIEDSAGMTGIGWRIKMIERKSGGTDWKRLAHHMGTPSAALLKAYEKPGYRYIDIREVEV